MAIACRGGGREAVVRGVVISKSVGRRFGRVALSTTLSHICMVGTVRVVG